MRRALALCIALVTLDRPAMATPSARLVYSRSPDAASCPDEDSLRRAVVTRFGYDPFFPWAKQAVVIQIWRGGNRYRSRIQVVDGQGVAVGTRELSSDRDDCSELFDATALAISIALDASVQSEPEPSAPPPPAPAPSAPPAPPTPSPSPPPIERPPEPSRPEAPVARGFAGLDFLGSAGTAPSPAFGGAAFVGVRFRALSAAVEGRIDAPASKIVSPGGSVTSWLFAASLVPCLHIGFGSACLLSSLGQIHAWSSGVSSPSSGSALFAALGGRIGAEVALSSALALRAHADLLVNLAPYDLQVSGTPGWSAPYVAGTLGVGIVVRFP
ncbi:MAG: hypothetical protein ACLQVI_17280 [Polyangiaceae bacterium]